MGVIGGIPASQKNLMAMVESTPADYSWQVIGIGRHQFPLGVSGVLMGGGVRVGFEDNVYLGKGVLARSNAELVEKIVKIVQLLGYEIATAEEARKILPGLNKP
jgi:3-keto-5-aminohexanoate cleavage enzyme